MASQQQRSRAPRNTQMADQIGGIRRDLKVKKTGFNHLKFPSVNSWEADGKDHINIWEFGQVELGQLLSVNFSLPFKHPVLGKFKSVRALWVYATTKEQDDALRNMDSRRISDYIKRVEAIKIKNFQAIILDTCFHRIKQTKVLAEAVIASTLPFDCYSASSQGLRTRAPFHRWFVAGMEEVRLALKENRAPDLTFLMDDPTDTLYKEIAPWYYEERNTSTKPRSENSLLSAIIADSKGSAPKPKAPKTETPAVTEANTGDVKAAEGDKQDVNLNAPGVLGGNFGATSTLVDTSSDAAGDRPTEEAKVETGLIAEATASANTSVNEDQTAQA